MSTGWQWALRTVLLTGAVCPAMAAAQTAAPTDGTRGVEATTTDQGEVVVTADRYVPLGAVTASKTTAPLIETPQSVSVITRDQIDLLNFTDVQQAVRYTAGIVGENYGPDVRFDFLTLRGFIPVQYIDGLQAPVSSTIANVGLDLYGFEAIDVLKGPSSVLYGTTPPGGIYNLTSRRPSARTGGELRAQYGSYDFKELAGTVTGSLGDGLSARLTGVYRDRDTQTDFVNARRAYAAPAVAWQIGADTQITALGYYQWDRVKGDTNGFLPAVGVLFPNPVGRVRRSVNLGEPDYNFYRREQWGAGYEFSHRFSPGLTFIQNVRWGEYEEYQQIIYGAGLGADNRTVSRFNFPFADNVAQFTADSRLEGRVATGAIDHRILAGFDYRNYREDSAVAFALAGNIDLFNPVYATAPIAVPALTPFTDQRLRQKGLYLQDQAHLGDVILTLSGRQDWVDIDNFRPGGVDRKQDKFTYRLGASYVTAAGLAPYVSYATSFQPLVGATFAGAAFDPTSGKQIEAGVKFDGRQLGPRTKLYATAAVFRIAQSNVLTPDPLNTGFSVQTGKVVSKGVELEAVARIDDRLNINAAYSYTDAKIARSNVPAEVGSRLQAQPRNKATLFVDYTLPMGLGGGAGVRYLSRSAGNTPATPASLVYFTPATTLFDAALHYDLPGWRFQLNGSNLFDKRYAGRCNGPVGCFFGQARQVTGTVTKRF